MAGLVIIRKAINTPILFNWYEFICHSLLSRLPSSSLPVTPGFIFVHALFVVCMLGTCLLSAQHPVVMQCLGMTANRCECGTLRLLLQKKRLVCTTLPAWIKSVCRSELSESSASTFSCCPPHFFSFYPLCRFCFLLGCLPLVDSFGWNPCFYLTFSSLSV